MIRVPAGSLKDVVSQHRYADEALLPVQVVVVGRAFAHVRLQAVYPAAPVVYRMEVYSVLLHLVY